MLVLCRDPLEGDGGRERERKREQEEEDDQSPEPRTLSAGLAPCSSRHLAAPRHRLEAAMCRAEPWLKSLQVEFTTAKGVRTEF